MRFLAAIRTATKCSLTTLILYTVAMPVGPLCSNIRLKHCFGPSLRSKSFGPPQLLAANGLTTRSNWVYKG